MWSRREQQDELDASTDEDRSSARRPDLFQRRRTLLDKYCLHCHDSISAQGGIVLDVFRDGTPDPRQRSLLLRVADNLRTENMPPEGEPRPNAEELETINSWLDTALIDRQSHCTSESPSVASIAPSTTTRFAT